MQLKEVEPVKPEKTKLVKGTRRESNRRIMGSRGMKVPGVPLFACGGIRTLIRWYSICSFVEMTGVFPWCIRVLWLFYQLSPAAAAHRQQAAGGRRQRCVRGVSDAFQYLRVV